MKRNKSERGQSLVELAISITVVVFLLSGAIEFGMMFFQYIQLRDAAQEGALYGSLNPTDINGIEDRVWGASSSPITDPESNISVTVTTSGSGCVGDGITVATSYDHKVFMPFIAQLIGSSTRTLNGSVTDTILNGPC